MAVGLRGCHYPEKENVTNRFIKVLEKLSSPRRKGGDNFPAQVPEMPYLIA